MNKKREQTTEQKNGDFKSEATNAQNKMLKFAGNLGQARWDPVSWAVWQEATVGVRERGRCAATLGTDRHRDPASHSQGGTRKRPCRCVPENTQEDVTTPWLKAATPQGQLQGRP